MKTLITADFHIDESKRLDDTESALSFIAKIVADKEPNGLIILGDIFNKRKPTPKELKVFNQWLMKVRPHVKNRILILEGNHDQDTGISSLRYLQDLFINKVRVVSPPYKWNGFYLGHEQISGALADNGTALLEGASLKKIIADNPECNVFAFGHFHRPQVLHPATPFAFYAGSVIKNTFSERYDRKSIWLFDGENEFVDDFTIPNRPMFQYEILICDDKNLMEHLNKNPFWTTDDLEGALVKIIFKGTKTTLKSVNVTNLKERILALKKAKDLKIIFDVIDQAKPRNEKINETASEEAILSEYFKNHPSKDIIVTKGLELIKEINNGNS